MHGVRVRWRSPDPRPWRGSDFARYFGSVLPRLRDLTWLVDAEAFRPPYDLADTESAAFDARRQWVECESRSIDYFPPHFACGPGFAPDFADWCNDDWNCLYGFDHPLADWRKWLRGRNEGSNSEKAAYLARTATVCFFAVDGAYWEFFAHDIGQVAEVADAAGVVAGMLVESVALADSVGL